MSDTYACQHFSLSKPLHDGAVDLPQLLRRAADQIEAHGIQPTDILDFTISQENIAEGPWWSATIYWSLDTQQLST